MNFKKQNSWEKRYYNHWSLVIFQWFSGFVNWLLNIGCKIISLLTVHNYGLNMSYPNFGFPASVSQLIPAS